MGLEILSPAIFDTEGVDSWKKDRINHQLRVWAYVLHHCGSHHDLHEELVAALDSVFGGPWPWPDGACIVAVPIGRAFIKDHIDDIEKVLSIYSRYDGGP